MPRSAVRVTTTRALGSWGRLSSVETWHVWAALAFALLSAIAYAALSGGGARMVVVVPFILVCPGHLLIQASVARELRVRPPLREALFAVGASPVVLGLAALSTVVLPGGFTATRIVLVTTLLCIAMAGVALMRHVRHGVVNASPTPQGP